MLLVFVRWKYDFSKNQFGEKNRLDTKCRISSKINSLRYIHITNINIEEKKSIVKYYQDMGQGCKTDRSY